MSKAMLSVELDPDLIERVQRYSEEHGKDVSETVSEMIQNLPLKQGGEDRDLPPTAGDGASASAETWEAGLTPEVQAILGAGAGPADEEDYHQHLMEKYGR